MKIKLIYHQGNNVLSREFEGTKIDFNLSSGAYVVKIDNIVKFAIGERTFISYELL